MRPSEAPGLGDAGPWRYAEVGAAGLRLRVGRRGAAGRSCSSPASARTWTCGHRSRDSSATAS